MSEYLKKRSKTHSVSHVFSGKQHFFKVKTDKDSDYDVSIKVNCGCNFMGVQGIANAQICSHILSVINKISTDGEIIKGDDMNENNIKTKSN